MKIPKPISKHPLFSPGIGLLIVIFGFLFQFYYQRKVAREDTQNSDIIALKMEIISIKSQVRSNRTLDSADYNEFDKRILRLENK